MPSKDPNLGLNGSPSIWDRAREGSNTIGPVRVFSNSILRSVFKTKVASFTLASLKTLPQNPLSENRSKEKRVKHMLLDVIVNLSLTEYLHELVQSITNFKGNCVRTIAVISL